MFVRIWLGHPATKCIESPHMCCHFAPILVRELTRDVTAAARIALRIYSQKRHRRILCRSNQSRQTHVERLVEKTASDCVKNRSMARGRQTTSISLTT